MKQIELTGEMTYSQALAKFAEAWPNLKVIWYRPTVEHYKEGRPTEYDLELAPNESLTSMPDRNAALRGDMRVQIFHSTLLSAFGLETELRDGGIRSRWMSTLDEANAKQAEKTTSWQ